MVTKIISFEPSDTEAALSGIRFNANWLIQLSNTEPQSFVGHEQEIYSLMNALQFVASRFCDRTAPIPRDQPRDFFDEQIGKIAEIMSGAT